MVLATRALPPYPSGWYVLAFSRQLPPGGLLRRAFVGRELVLWRGRSGARHGDGRLLPAPRHPLRPRRRGAMSCAGNRLLVVSRGDDVVRVVPLR